MLVTNKTQEAMELAIATYLDNYDKIAQQYVAVRHEVLALYNRISKQVQGGASVADDDQKRVAELEAELERVAVVYERHVRYLERATAVAGRHSGGTLESVLEVEQFHETIENEERALQEEINYIHSIKGSVLEDMRALVRDVDASLARQPRGSTNNGGSNRSGNTSRTSVESRTFSREELKALVDDIRLDGGGGDSDMLVSLTRYLDEQLSNGRAFQKSGADTYVYDPRSSSVRDADIAVAGAEYDTRIDQMVRSIATLIADNARAKESWGENARLLEAVHETLLRETRDVEMGE